MVLVFDNKVFSDGDGIVRDLEPMVHIGKKSALPKDKEPTSFKGMQGVQKVPGTGMSVMNKWAMLETYYDKRLMTWGKGRRGSKLFHPSLLLGQDFCASVGRALPLGKRTLLRNPYSPYPFISFLFFNSIIRSFLIQ